MSDSLLTADLNIEAIVLDFDEVIDIVDLPDLDTDFPGFDQSAL